MPGVVAHSFNLRTLETVAGESLEFQASLVGEFQASWGLFPHYQFPGPRLMLPFARSAMGFPFLCTEGQPRGVGGLGGMYLLSLQPYLVLTASSSQEFGIQEGLSSTDLMWTVSLLCSPWPGHQKWQASTSSHSYYFSFFRQFRSYCQR